MITLAYKNAPPKEISVYDFSQVIFAAGLGFIAFDQVPDVFSFIGYVVIISMAVLSFLYSNNILIHKNKNN